MRTRSSATAQEQRVSCACLYRLANRSCSSVNTAAVVHIVLLLN